ncbi:MAG: hypothetical protein GTN64_05460 [Candidatus Latescibacteria bacterium]|nr:hypothetical protein [Candidatus Latescibacterota bacterium]NIO78057.1 hypothetical protein [Candidatus Latescibacterota bacterium]
MIDDAIYTLLTTDPTVSGIVGDKVFPNFVPIDTPLPAISYRRLAVTDRAIYHNGIRPGAKSRYQFMCITLKPIDSKTLSEGVRTLFNGFSGTVGSDLIYVASIVNEVDLSDKDLGFTVAIDVLFTHKE